jgi:spermidine synthase
LEGALQWRMSTLASGFERVRYGSVTIATYPTGQIGFLLCEKRPRDPRQLQTRYRAMVADGGKKKTTYYHPKLQTSSFDLPLWVEEKLYGSH